VLYSDSGRQQKCSQSFSSMIIPETASAQLLPPVETSVNLAGPARPRSLRLPLPQPLWSWLYLRNELSEGHRVPERLSLDPQECTTAAAKGSSKKQYLSAGNEQTSNLTPDIINPTQLKREEYYLALVPQRDSRVEFRLPSSLPDWNVTVAADSKVKAMLARIEETVSKVVVRA
jgi:hypothetical protein